MNYFEEEEMTERELALILNIREETVKKLAETKQIPSRKKENKMCFNFFEILMHFHVLEGGATC